MDDSDRIASEIEAARFTEVRLREGYDILEVDHFLDELVEAARAGAALAPLIEAARFSPVRLRSGYDMGEVDDFLARISDGGRSTGPAPAVPAASRRDDGGNVEGYNAIRKVRGPLEWLRDLFRS